MNAPQFMAHVAFQQEVTECRAALRDAKQMYRGKLNHLRHTYQVDKVEDDFQRRLDAIQETRACALDRAGLTTPGLPR